MGTRSPTMQNCTRAQLSNPSRTVNLKLGVPRPRLTFSKQRYGLTRDVATAAWVIEPFSLPPLDLAATPRFDERYVKVTHYSELQENKNFVADEAGKVGATKPQRALMVAIAMQESKLMNERDYTKDNMGKSKNCSILNLNLDLIERAGYNKGDACDSLNHGHNLKEALKRLKKTFDKYGEKSTLDFIRGGSTALGDGVSYGAEDYRRAMATIYAKFNEDPKLLHDDRRVEINVDPV